MSKIYLGWVKKSLTFNEMYGKEDGGNRTKDLKNGILQALTDLAIE